jgi:hypothetical protein
VTSSSKTISQRPGFGGLETTRRFLVKPGGICYDFSGSDKRLAMIIA